MKGGYFEFQNKNPKDKTPKISLDTICLRDYLFSTEIEEIINLLKSKNLKVKYSSDYIISNEFSNESKYSKMIKIVKERFEPFPLNKRDIKLIYSTGEIIIISEYLK